MPYLRCHRCHRTAWVRKLAGEGVACRGCGTPLSTLTDRDAAHLADAVRDRFERDTRRDVPRFVRGGR